MNNEPLDAFPRPTSATRSAHADVDQLGNALSQLEACLETPVVPGELPSWAKAVEAACDAMREPLRHNVESSHPEHFAEISSEEPDLLRQVEQMREEDSKLGEVYAAFSEKVRQFRQQAKRVEPHESKLNEFLSGLTEEGLRLVIRVRKQRQAISTWMLEAYQRDTGVAD